MDKDLLGQITILYEDEKILAINKPAGLVVHGDERGKEGVTLADWILRERPEIEKVGEPFVTPQGVSIARPGIVHRLDKDTSGVLLIAKTNPAYFWLKSQFKRRLVKKIYHAMVVGEVEKEDGMISKPIGRSEADIRKMTVARATRGLPREAVTYYRVIARHNGFSFVELLPKTGRMHQIRVHMAAIRHPVICDKVYGRKDGETFGLSRHALHARSIELPLYFSVGPKSSKPLIINAPYPEDFMDALQKAGLLEAVAGL